MFTFNAVRKCNCVSPLSTEAQFECTNNTVKQNNDLPNVLLCSINGMLLK